VPVGLQARIDAGKRPGVSLVLRAMSALKVIYQASRRGFHQLRSILYLRELLNRFIELLVLKGLFVVSHSVSSFPHFD
jgi:hypothetical protein